MGIRIIQLGSPRAPHEGLRLGAVRHRSVLRELLPSHDADLMD